MVNNFAAFKALTQLAYTQCAQCTEFDGAIVKHPTDDTVQVIPLLRPISPAVDAEPYAAMKHLFVNELYFHASDVNLFDRDVKELPTLDQSALEMIKDSLWGCSFYRLKTQKPLAVSLNLANLLIKQKEKQAAAFALLSGDTPIPMAAKRVSAASKRMAPSEDAPIAAKQTPSSTITSEGQLQPIDPSFELPADLSLSTDSSSSLQSTSMPLDENIPTVTPASQFPVAGLSTIDIRSIQVPSAAIDIVASSSPLAVATSSMSSASFAEAQALLQEIEALTLHEDAYVFCDATNRLTAEILSYHDLGTLATIRLDHLSQFSKKVLGLVHNLHLTCFDIFSIGGVLEGKVVIKGLTVDKKIICTLVANCNIKYLTIKQAKALLTLFIRQNEETVKALYENLDPYSPKSVGIAGRVIDVVNAKNIFGQVSILPFDVYIKQKLLGISQSQWYAIVKIQES